MNERQYREGRVLSGEDGTIGRETFIRIEGVPLEGGPYRPLPSGKVTGDCSGRERGRLEALAV